MTSGAAVPIARFVGVASAVALLLGACTDGDGGFAAATDHAATTTSIQRAADGAGVGGSLPELFVDVPDDGVLTVVDESASRPSDGQNDSSAGTMPGSRSSDAASEAPSHGATTAPLDTPSDTRSDPPSDTPTTTTLASTTTKAPSTVAPNVGGNGSRFVTLAPGSSLPSGATCAARITPSPETRAGNVGPNNTRGVGANDRYPRVDGDFVGTTDEILQWAACKWGIDEDIVRAQATIESWWRQSNGGDYTSDQSRCHPDVQTSSGSCPESVGLLQVRQPFHTEAFENGNAVRSSAYNVDYAYAHWRSCFEGEIDWLNTVERGAEYRAGDVDGCLGVWFAGRWRTEAAMGYVNELKGHLRARTWEQPDFLGHG